MNVYASPHYINSNLKQLTYFEEKIQNSIEVARMEVAQNEVLTLNQYDNCSWHK